MAKKNDNAGGIFFWMLVGLLIVLPLVPIAWIIYTLIKLYKWKKNQKYYPNQDISDFWLDNQEKIEFLESLNDFRKSKSNIDDLWATADNEGLPRNQDGSISNRRNRGKEINNQLNFENDIYNKSKSRLFYLREKPNDKWNYLKDYFVSYYGAIYALLFWFVAFYYSLKYFFKKPLLSVFEIYDKIFTERTEYFIALKENWELHTIYALSISAIVSLIVFYICKYLAGKFIFKNKYPEPPIVDYSNYDKY
ncbi:hypothetical protein [Tenacibaculum sp. UWU-22]|uniref:hypothetical protein n=1 Tax=Tenacibaculum sp. UWU-22 TaxID=3234187 RepID=UPI0034DB1908